MAVFPAAKTNPVRARILTDDYEIEGNIHLKMGPYRARISDILNSPDIEFLPVTQAHCMSRSGRTVPLSDARCTIIQVNSIRMVFPLED